MNLSEWMEVKWKLLTMLTLRMATTKKEIKTIFIISNEKVSVKKKWENSERMKISVDVWTNCKASVKSCSAFITLVGRHSSKKKKGKKERKCHQQQTRAKIESSLFRRILRADPPFVFNRDKKLFVSLLPVTIKRTLGESRLTNADVFSVGNPSYQHILFFELWM